MDVHGSDGETETLEGRRDGFDVVDEKSHVIEENLVRFGKLTINPAHAYPPLSQTFAPLSAGGGLV
jgi:hypothetical protein